MSITYKPSAEVITNLMASLTTAFNDKFGATPSQYTAVATVVPMDEKGLVFGWLTSDDDLEAWTGSRVIKSISAHGYRIEPTKYTKTLGISFDDIRDGKFTTAVLQASGLGRSAARFADKKVFGVLKANPTCYDGKALFAADHNVNGVDGDAGTFSNDITGGNGATWYLSTKDGHAVIYGVREDIEFGQLAENGEHAYMNEQVVFGVRARVAASAGLPQFAVRSNKALTATALQEAIDTLTAIPGPEGEPIARDQLVLIVPKSLEAAAKCLVLGDRNDKGGYNPYFGAAELVASPYL